MMAAMRNARRAGPTWCEYVAAHQRIALRTLLAPLSEEEAERELADQAILNAWRSARRRTVLTLVPS
jgi:hypothetical protein